MSSEGSVVLPGGEVRAHGVLTLLPQDLLDQRRIGHVHRQDGTEARLPHGPIASHSFQLGTRQTGRDMDELGPH